MIRIGEYQTLAVRRKVDFGVYLGDGETEVLLPKRQVPEKTRVGDAVTVFIYRDSDDRLIATVNKPLLTLGRIAPLKVKETTQIGAFLDWGLERDLFLPFKEQTRRVRAGDVCPVALYLDKSGRLCATMKIYDYLRADSPYAAGDEVNGTVFRINQDVGVFVAVDDRYYGMIPRQEVTRPFYAGEKITARVLSVREDGKLNLSVRRKSYLEIEDNAEIIYKKIENAGGTLPYTDKASPERIREDFQMSKNDFKKAVGRLLKEKRIQIGENWIKTLHLPL